MYGCEWDPRIHMRGEIAFRPTAVAPFPTPMAGDAHGVFFLKTIRSFARCVFGVEGSWYWVVTYVSLAGESAPVAVAQDLVLPMPMAMVPGAW
jgi:hypothetical protein